MHSLNVTRLKDVIDYTDRLAGGYSKGNVLYRRIQSWIRLANDCLNENDD